MIPGNIIQISAAGMADTDTALYALNDRGQVFMLKSKYWRTSPDTLGPRSSGYSEYWEEIPLNTIPLIPDGASMGPFT